MTVKLNLGCGADIRRHQDWINVDRRQLPGVQKLHDLNVTPWPFADRSVALIHALHIVEHLQLGLVRFCDECWRILVRGGTAYIEVPDAADLDLAWCDPEHVRPYRKHSFINYLTPEGIGNFHYTERAWSILDLYSDGHIIRAHMQPIIGERAATEAP